MIACLQAGITMSRTLADSMTVCLITPYPPNRHGLSEYSESLIRALEATAKKQVSLHVFCFKEGDDHVVSATDSGTLIHRLLTPGSANPLLTVKSIPELLGLVVFLGKLKPDIVHIEFEFTRYFGGTIGEPFVFAVGLAKALLGFRLVSTLQSVWPRRWLGQRIREVINLGILGQALSGVFAVYYNAVERLLVTTSDIILVPTLTLGLRTCPELRAKYAQVRMLEIPHGVYEVAESRRVKKSESFTILSFGGIRRGKGHEHLIEMIRRLKLETKRKVRLVIAGFPNPGDPNYPKELTDLIAKYGLSEEIVFIPRYLQLNEIVEWHRVADVVIMSYTRMVGASAALMWAMATDTVPIIVAGEVWTPEVPGIVVHDQEQMVRVVAGLLDDDNALGQIRDKIAKYRSTYSFSNVAKLHLEQYRAVLADRARVSSHRPKDASESM